MMEGAYTRLPQELKELRQWVLAAADGSPCVLGVNGLRRTSIHSHQEWYSFSDACKYASEQGTLIGIILTEKDPYTVIDLDVVDEESQLRKGKPVDPTKWTTPEDHARYDKILTAFNSFTEISRGGKGFHIFVRGNIGKGRRRDNVEVYSQERFMICTGNAYIEEPIREGGELLATLVEEMTAHDEEAVVLCEVEEARTDADIVQSLSHQDNGQKFDDLCNGKWQLWNFPSQSEADLALMSMFTFLSPSNAQCRRLFKMSLLGRREKCTTDYMDRMLTVIRGRQLREEKVASYGEQLAKELVEELIAKSKTIPQAPMTQTPEGPKAKLTLEKNVEKRDLDYPPGLAGYIAKFIYDSAPRPVKEVAIVATLGLLAGLCGKAYHIPQSGLNLYIILVARSAVGKEAMHSGISLLISKIRESVPQIGQFVDFSDFASGQALIKACAANPSFVNVSGEWGRKLKKIANDNVDSPMQVLRTIMTNLYQKSGPASTVGGLTYSNSDKNVQSIAGVAYSLIGETTPGTFYETLTEQMMEDGFMSRFTVIEYSGDRPAMNMHQKLEPDKYLREAFSALAVQAITLLNRFQSQIVVPESDAKKMLDDFDEECDRQINKTQEEAWRQMWNRAHLKSYRIAALLAVADNWIEPKITKEHVHWAIDVVRRDINIMADRLNSGDVGVTDHARESKLISIMADYIVAPIANSYQIPERMRAAGLIPRKYLNLRTCKCQCFYNHRSGATIALEMTLKSMIDSGYITEVRKEVLLEYGYTGKAYAITDRSVFAKYLP